jgi:uroporphyrinogen decarboxylase
MPRSQLTHHERMTLALEHRDTDRIPISMVCSGIHQPVYGQLESMLQEERGIGVIEYLWPILDIVLVLPKYVGPHFERKTDHWGVRRKKVDFGMGSYEDEIEYQPLAGATSVDDVLKHAWPSPDWFDYSGIPEKIAQINANGKHYIMSGWASVWECSWYMRGFEAALMDLVENPELINSIMKKVTEFQLEFHRRILEAGNGDIDLIFCGDDIGTQRGLLMSLDTFETNIKPYHTQMNAMIHRHDARVIYHSDGAIMKAVPALVDMGIDILQPLQFDAAGMGPEALKTTYGDVLSFEGGVSVQKTLPLGTVDDVREEVRNLIRLLGSSGGYILGPSHVIQAGTPAQNILAMFDTALETEL